MDVAITLCRKTKHERREDKHDHSFLHRSEAEPLPHVIEFEAPVSLQFLACSFFCYRTILLMYKGHTEKGSGNIKNRDDFRE